MMISKKQVTLKRVFAIEASEIMKSRNYKNVDGQKINAN